MSEFIRVANRKAYAGAGEYIGRPSPLGNPYIVDVDGDREMVIYRYESWLRLKLSHDTPCRTEFNRLLDLARTARDTGTVLVLICWCAPLVCHGGVLKRKLEDVLRLLDETSKQIVEAAKGCVCDGRKDSEGICQ